MSCRGCDKTKEPLIFDRRGNKVSKEDMDKMSSKDIMEGLVSYDGTPLSGKDMNEILNDRKFRSEFLAKQKEDLIDNMTDNVKRLIIIDLISAYNLEEVSVNFRSREGALVALWQYVHHSKFQGVVSEFGGLTEEVDKKYNEFKNTCIKSSWKFS